MQQVAEVVQIFPPTADVAVNIGGTVTYTPPAGYPSEGGFVYRVRGTQGLWSNDATALIAVQP
jgi:hypothetical protein